MDLVHRALPIEALAKARAAAFEGHVAQQSAPNGLYRARLGQRSPAQARRGFGGLPISRTERSAQRPQRADEGAVTMVLEPPSERAVLPFPIPVASSQTLSSEKGARAAERIAAL